MPKICIIGAGLAGLSAAETLIEKGIEVTVLEARNRVGGRTWSRTLSNGARIEMGAEYADLTSFELVSTIARLGLFLVPAGVSFYNREPRGGTETTKDEIFAAVDVVKQYLARNPQRMFKDSVANVLADVPISAGARNAIAARIQTTNAHPVEDLSAYLLAHVPFSNAEGLHISGGNQSIALKLAERCKSSIKLSQTVEDVSWSHGGGVNIRTTSGETYEADSCIVTVPASVYPQIKFHPELPEWKNTAMASVTYSQPAKLFVPLRRDPLPSSVLIVPDFVWSWTAKGEDGRVQPVVGAYAGSLPALQKLKVFEGPKAWFERLRTMRPELEMEEEGVVLSTWTHDPLVHGAYSVRTPNIVEEHYDQLSRPVGCLHFAGEHTTGSAFGDMNAALQSGYRVAKEILAEQD